MLVLRLARRTVRHNAPRFVASFVALAFAALIVAVAGGLLETGIRDDVTPQRLAGAPILVTGEQSYFGEALSEETELASDVAAAVAAVPGVARVVGDVSFPVTVADHFAVTGHGWSSAALTPFALQAGHAPAGPDEAVVDRGLADRLGLHLGSELSTLASGTPTTLPIVGIVAATTAQSPTLFVSDNRAQTLIAHPGRVDALSVFPSSGAAVGDSTRLVQRLRATLASRGDQALVVSGENRGRAEFPLAAGQSSNLIPLAAAAGGLMTAVSIFTVASTLTLAVELRRRQIALLRAIGGTPGQLRRLTVSETVLLAGPAVAVGLLPSAAIGRRVLQALAGHGLVAERLQYHQGYLPLAAAAGVAVLTSLLAALVAARPAIRVRPVEALAREQAPVGRMGWARRLFGLLTLAGAVALAVVTALVFNGPIAASTAEPSAILWAAAAALLAPLLLRPISFLLGWLAAVLAPRTGVLARQTLAGRGHRNSAIAVSVLLATGLATALLYLQTTQQSAAEQAYAQHLTATRVLTASDGQLPLSLADRVASLPGVASASPLVSSTGFFEQKAGADPDNLDDVPLEGISGTQAGYPVIAGSLSALDTRSSSGTSSGAVALAAEYRRPGRDVGDTVALRFGDGSTAELRIVVIVKARSGYPIVLMPPALLAAHTHTGLADQILVEAQSGADLARLDAELRGLGPQLAISDRSAAISAFSDQEKTGQWVGYLLIAALVFHTAVSVVNTTIAATAQRRSQLRTLRLIASRRQVTRALTIEAAVIASGGVVLGSGVALAVLLPFDRALGQPGLPAGPASIFLAVNGAAVALTAGVTWLAARWLASRPGV